MTEIQGSKTEGHSNIFDMLKILQEPEVLKHVWSMSTRDDSKHCKFMHFETSESHAGNHLNPDVPAQPLRTLRFLRIMLILSFWEDFYEGSYKHS